jgi:DHA2 family multidrug resistance protein
VLVVAVVLTAILEVLDITIVSVATPHMLGSFGATPDQINWVLTSYLVSAAVIMPLTGYLSEWLGRRRLLFLSISGFIASSALCGTSWTLASMVVFRLAQGICGAPLVPLSQAILLDAFPRDKHGQALAVFGLGIMVAPVLGPTLGGWLTDTFSWRAVFYINVPVGLLALLLSMGRLPTRRSSNAKPTGRDFSCSLWRWVRSSSFLIKGRCAIGSTRTSSRCLAELRCFRARPFSCAGGTSQTTS